MPFILYQVWLFVAPGLYSHEKKFAIPFVLFSSVFFFGGALFSHYVAFPVTWRFFISFSTDYMKFMPKIGEAFGLYVKMLLGFGADLPDADAGVLPGAHGHGDGRFLLKHFKYAVLIIFILAAVLSPGTDIVSQ